MFVSAKEFCEETGFPARTLVRYLREGKIDCHRAGRRYVLDKEMTLERLQELSRYESALPVVYRNNSRRKKKINHSDIFDGAQSYEERISRLKNDISKK